LLQLKETKDFNSVYIQLGPFNFKFFFFARMYASIKPTMKPKVMLMDKAKMAIINVTI